MRNTPRAMAVQILNRVDESRAYAEPLLDACLASNSLLHPSDKKLLTQIVYGTLRMRGFVDWIIQHHYRGDFSKMDVGIKNILRTGLYQFWFTERIPEFAIVNDAVEIAKSLCPGRAGLINAILRNVVRNKDKTPFPELQTDPALHIAVMHSHPLWLVKKWLETFGTKETKALCEANNKIPPVTLRVNRLKTTKQKLTDQLRNKNIKVFKTHISPDGLIVSNLTGAIRDMPAYRMGYFQVQDEASQMITHLVAPQPGETILDLCAGIGGKTTHLAEIMENRGKITAIDNNKSKIAALQKNLKRHGIHIVDCIVADATADLGTSFHEKFDRVFVDAPCSGFGTLRRNPEIKWRTTAEDLPKIVNLQLNLLSACEKYLKKGGYLVYSTCSVMKEENEEVIKSFLDQNKTFRQIFLSNQIHHHLIDHEGFLKTFPHQHNMDGFFGVLLMKI
jgi:16S rRNA (cytosine967-C5)-methyltransferase